MAKSMKVASVVRQEQIGTDIYSMIVDCPDIADAAIPGQFVSLFTGDNSRLLPRPISICDAGEGKLRFVYRVAGAGTGIISGLKSGDSLRLIGPLGNGYTLDEREAILIGGGIGIPPMLYLAKKLKQKGVSLKIVLGYRDEEFLKSEFDRLGEVYVSSDTGFMGVKGTVIDAINEYSVGGQMIYACGPKPMLKAIKTYAEKNGIKAQLSLEERMACGIGACLACVCETAGIDDHSKVNNARVCADGPVFDSEEVVL